MQGHYILLQHSSLSGFLCICISSLRPKTRLAHLSRLSCTCPRNKSWALSSYDCIYYSQQGDDIVQLPISIRCCQEASQWCLPKHLLPMQCLHRVNRIKPDQRPSRLSWLMVATALLLPHCLTIQRISTSWHIWKYAAIHRMKEAYRIRDYLGWKDHHAVDGLSWLTAPLPSVSALVGCQPCFHSWRPCQQHCAA